MVYNYSKPPQSSPVITPFASPLPGKTNPRSQSYVCSEEVLRVKLPTYGQMQQQLWKQSQKRNKSEEKESVEIEDEGARKGPGQASGLRGEKLHAVVARSRFWSRNGQNTFWKLRCQQNARCCGMKHISKPIWEKHTKFGQLLDWDGTVYAAVARSIRSENVTSRTTFGLLLEVEMWKKCMPSWHKAHLEVKMQKTPYVRTTFGRWSAISRGRRNGFCTLPRDIKKNVWLLIKTPLSANRHSSRIKMLLSRNFRELHVYLSRGSCWATVPLMKIRWPPAKLRQRITDHFLILIAF